MKKRINKVELAETILGHLLRCPLATVDLLYATTPSKRETMRNLWKQRDNPNDTPSAKIVESLKNYRREYMKYHTFLSRLKKQGLISQSGTRKARQWSLTAAGKSLLEKFRKQSELTKKALEPGGISIVSYDIPERLHAERDSMRELLKFFGFKYIHQSLWYINATVKKEFVDYLREKRLIDYIHIFQVSKSGTLESIK